MRARPSTRGECSDLAWLEDHVGVLTRSATGITAVKPDGSIGGVVGFDSWHPGSVYVHIACESPLAWRCLAAVVWDYAFNERGVSQVLAVIPSHRHQAVRMATRLGFKSTHRVTDGFCPGSDLVHFAMTRAECRFLSRQSEGVLVDHG